MTSVLAELVAETRTGLEARRRLAPAPARERHLAPASHRFAAALERPGPALILEVKRASPSEGALRRDCDPGAIAAEYEGAASAVSVVTAAPKFGGSLADLARARAGTTLPLLCKDFVVDPVQVIEARAHGADAILLMLSVLDDTGYRRCAATAAALGMDVLTEVHDAPEAARAVALGARIIGINNRDLRTLAVDLGVTERLAPLIPRDRVVVSESGIRSREEIRRLSGHARGFLIGTTLMRSPRPGVAARELAYGRVKICGLTSPDDARRAWAAGASLGGVILAESPRRVEEARASEIAAASPLMLVGVFVNERPAAVAGMAARLGLAAVQLHGDESPGDVRGTRALVPAGCEVWKVVPVRSAAEVPRVGDLGADRLVAESAVPGQRGGGGRPFAWEELDRHPDRTRLVLAGGISPANAGLAARTGCGTLDLASGVESSPGVKDARLLGLLFDALREAAC